MASLPIVDPQNPLYCPSIPAAVYLNDIRLHIRAQRPTQQVVQNVGSAKIRKRSIRDNAMPSFTRMLGRFSLMQSQDKEDSDVNMNYCVDFGTPPIRTTGLKEDSQPKMRKISKVLANNTPRKDRPRTRAQSKLEDKRPQQHQIKIPHMSPTDLHFNPKKDTLKADLAISSPQISSISIRNDAYNPPLSKSCAPQTIPLWDISGSSDSTIASQCSPMSSIANARRHSDEQPKPVLLPPGLGHVQTSHQTPNAIGAIGVGQQHKPLLVTTKPQIRVYKDSGTNPPVKQAEPKGPQRTLLRFRSRKRKLEQHFPDLFSNPGSKKQKVTLMDRGASFDWRNRTQIEVPDEGGPFTGPTRGLQFHLDRSLIRTRVYSPGPPTGGDVKGGEVVERVKMLEDALYGQPIGTETPRGYKLLLDRLDVMMPGIRLKERLSTGYENSLLVPFGHGNDIGNGRWNWNRYATTRTGSRVRDCSHQGVVDFLGEEGLLNERVMEMFRTSEIKRLDMASSLADEDGLNIGGYDIIKVFSKPNSFLFLLEISFNGTRVRDMDLLHILRLPRLKRLCLDNTGIGNEAIYHLTALQHTLCSLSLAHNPGITDDAVPALVLLSKLGFLCLVGTSIGMVGLRRLAVVVGKEGRAVDVEIPESCELYIVNLESSARYVLYPQPPLISSPLLCMHLSIGALQRNLEAHFAAAARVATAKVLKARSQLRVVDNVVPLTESLTKEEMREKLEGILRMREADLLVKGMVFG
ncbi:hypothetical protein WG66_011992 [Moniliophthora roreri]|nr:hypothetical protein WG66_011992 [Moniliophthora roreri]